MLAAGGPRHTTGISIAKPIGQRSRNRLRNSVHEVCVEVNKGIFNNLETVLLRLVDAIEEVSAGKAELIQAVDAYLENDSTANWERLYEARDAVVSTERRERDG